MRYLAVLCALACAIPGARAQIYSTGNVTLQDKVYFGSAWELLDKQAPGAPIPQGNGYGDVEVIRSSDGTMFAGIVDKRDASGTITDVILSFTGATGADAVQGEAILLGIPLDEAASAVALYQGLLDNPSYANARIHVMGHSLGAGYSEYVCAYALATYGAVATDARADFVGFGAPNWQQSAALHYGLNARALDGHFIGYTAANDPVRANGVTPAGIDYVLPAYDGAQIAALNPIGAHSPTTYMSALGTPDWMDAATTQYVIAQAYAGYGTPLYGDGYARPQPIPLTINGDAAGETLVGLAGDDTIAGGAGHDVLTGGGGADRFVFAAGDSGADAATADRITDFSQTQGDKIDLSAIDARPDMLLKQQLTFVPGGRFTGPGQVTSWVDGNVTWVAINLNADPAPEMLIRLDGAISLGVGDFVL
ncbi:MAG TPA: M10 family metallopeptidase C-terminal domain-containing protein [Sphingomonas sp.]